MMKAELVPAERIERAIFVLRGHCHARFGSRQPVRRGNEGPEPGVGRNLERFPGDFMFRLTPEEAQALRSQIVTLDAGRGKHRKYLPHAFTEQGVAMLSSVLRSPRAVRVNIEIMRAFVRLRRMLSSNAELAKKLDALERKYDAQFRVVFQAIRELMTRKKIGFRGEEP